MGMTNGAFIINLPLTVTVSSFERTHVTYCHLTGSHLLSNIHVKHSH